MVANRWGGGLSQTVAWAFWPLHSHISNLPNWHFCEENKLLVERTGRRAVSLLRSPSVISDTYWSQSSVEPGDSDDWSLFTATSSGLTHQLHHLLVSQSSIPGSSHHQVIIDQQYLHINVFLNDNRWTGKLLTFKMYCNGRFSFFGAGKCHHQAYLKAFRCLHFFNASIIQTTIFNLGSSREGLPAILTDSGLDSRLRVVTTEKSISLGCTQIKMPGPWKENAFTETEGPSESMRRRPDWTETKTCRLVVFCDNPVASRLPRECGLIPICWCP